MTKILVTGGAGHLGGSLVRRLVKKNDYDVVILDDLSTGDKTKLPSDNYSNWSFVEGSVNDTELIDSLMGNHLFDYVFHYAAVVGVARTLSNPVSVLEDIDGIKNIVNNAIKNNVKRVFYASSSEVYGEPVEIPQYEDTTPLNSKLPYAIVKNVGEAYLRSYQVKYDLCYTIFRFFNTYGPLQTDDFVISKFLKAALSGEAITIYGDGSQTRTFCYVDDNVNAVINAFEKERYLNETINIGSDIEISVLELAEKVINITNSNSSIARLPPLKEGDMTRRKPDLTKMRELSGNHQTPLEEGLRMMLASERWKI